jgi:hypothetical protein
MHSNEDVGSQGCAFLPSVFIDPMHRTQQNSSAKSKNKPSDAAMHRVDSIGAAIN